jgi:hypothetical protein
MTQRVITKLKIEELSSIDRPAQPGALVAIMKRDDGGAAERFGAMAQEIQKRDGCMAHQAMERTRVEHPDLFEALQDAPIAVPVEKRVPDAAQTAVANARTAFMDRAHQIAKRDGVPVHVGMNRARIEAPELLAGWA